MRLFSMMAVLLLDPSPEAGGGGTGAGSGAANQNTSIAPADYAAALRETASAKAETERYRNLYEDTKGKLPAEGTRVLTKDEATEFEAFRGLKLKPADIQIRLTERDTFHGQVATFEREKLLGEAGKLANLNPTVLGKLPGCDKLVIEIRDAQVDGKPQRVAEVVETEKGKGENGADKVTRTALDKFAEKTWPEFAASLKADGTPSPKPIGSPRIVPRTNPAPAGGNGQGQQAGAVRRRPTWN